MLWFSQTPDVSMAKTDNILYSLYILHQFTVHSQIQCNSYSPCKQVIGGHKVVTQSICLSVCPYFSEAQLLLNR